MMKLRRFNRLYARLNGYAWLPCPVCKREFGGHEWKDRKGLSSVVKVEGDRSGMFRGICPDCTLAGKGDERWRNF